MLTGKDERFDVEVEIENGSVLEENGMEVSESEEDERESGEGKYLADMIGESYREWTNGFAYFIKAPTGTGKSHFVLHVLLKHVIQNRGKILYLVNRKVLKGQLEEELKSKVVSEVRKYFADPLEPLGNYIVIETYQSIESRLKSNNPQKAIKFLEKFSWAVYDECDYFYTDSTFNTNTELSYDCLRRMFLNKIEIFMSATIDNVKKLIQNRPAECLPFLEEHRRLKAEQIPHNRDCTVDVNDRKIRTTVFDTMEELISYILTNTAKGSDKWLIFVDSIDMGKKLKQKLISRGEALSEDDLDDTEAGESTEASQNDDDLEGTEESENTAVSKNAGDLEVREGVEEKKRVLLKDDVAFIDADFKEDPQMDKSVQRIILKKLAKERVVISTAVMDNGISFHDMDLRNIAIFADTKEMFIQMLGRKRKDGKETNLYICRRDREYFRKRREGVKKILDSYQLYYKKLENSLVRYVLWSDQYGYWQMKRKIHAFTELYYDSLRPSQVFGYIVRRMQASAGEPIKQQLECYYVENFFTEAVVSKNNLIYASKHALEDQKRLIDKMFSDEELYRKLKKICYFVDGRLVPNSFALSYYLDLQDFYGKMIEALEEDKDAFVKEQFEWMGISEEDRINIMKEEEEKKRELLEEKIKEKLGESMSKQEAIDWKMKDDKLVANLFDYFLQKSESYKETTKGGFKKNERVISEKNFNKCMELVGLPYKLKLQRANQRENKATAYIIQEKCAAK